MVFLRTRNQNDYDCARIGRNGYGSRKLLQVWHPDAVLVGTPGYSGLSGMCQNAPKRGFAVKAGMDRGVMDLFEHLLDRLLIILAIGVTIFISVKLFAIFLLTLAYQ